MSQEFRLSIKNFSQRKIVNVKDIFKNLTESEKEILEREKRRAEEKALREQELYNNRLNNINIRSKTSPNVPFNYLPKQPPVNIIRRAKLLEEKNSKSSSNDLSKSSNQLIQTSNKSNDINSTNNVNNNRSNKSNKSRTNLVYAYEPNEEKNSYEENYKRYINQIDLNLNRILNEKKLNKIDFELIHKITAKKPQNPNNTNNKQFSNLNKKDDYPIFIRPTNENYSERIWIDNNEKLNKFNGFKKKIKNLFASDEQFVDFDANLSSKKFNEHRPVRIIQINNNNNNNKESKFNKNTSQFFDNDVNDTYYMDSNNKWNNSNNNYNKNFKYKPTKNNISFQNNPNTTTNNRYNNQSNDAFISNPSDTKFRKLSNLLNRTKNLLH